MSFLIHGIIGFTCIFAIICTCVFFTNAIEHLGCKLKLGDSAVGSILAVIGTSLPETIVPLVAIFGAVLLNCNLSVEVSKDIAKGAIIGSPFMLSTFAFFLLAFTLLISYFFKKRSKLELNLNYKNILRDAKYFLLGYIPAIFSTFLINEKEKIFVVFYLVILYAIFVYRTIKKSVEKCEELSENELYFEKFFSRTKENKFIFIFLQIFVSLVALVFFSHTFVHEIKYFSIAFNISPLILSLIITPFATELPECVNSVIWLLNKKDELAIANVTGATIFQAMIVTSIGIIFTDWKLDSLILLNAIFVISSVILFILSTLIYKKIKFLPLLLCGIFYFSYLIYILTK